MGNLTVYSTSALQPMGHNGTILEYDNGMPTEWLGFALDSGQLYTPSWIPLLPVLESGWDGGPGFIVTDVNTNRISRYVKFPIDDMTLTIARNNVVCDYLANNYYHLLYRDCVSFARDMAKACGLSTRGCSIVPPMLPYYLYEDNNQYGSQYDAMGLEPITLN